MTKTELASRLNAVIQELVKMVAELQAAALPAGGNDGTKCPVHGVPWQQTKYGLAHPPTRVGEKWCNKEQMEKSRR